MLIGIALAALPMLALAGLALGRFGWIHAGVHGGTAVACLFLLGGGLEHLGGPLDSSPALTLPFGLPWLGAHFRLDNLSAFFMVVVNLSGAAAGFFGAGYAGHLPEPRRVTPLFPLFLFGMNGVLVADDAFIFLVSWEFMSLSSWGLVLAEHRSEENRHAAFVYLCMAAFGTLCLLPAFGLMAGPEGAYDFPSMRVADLGPATSFLVVLLTLLGAGSKAGLVPLHAWLPLAHPAAPSHVSALMSGVMTKVAIYAMVRVLMDLHGNVGWQWGAAMMVVGGLTAVLGVLYAVMQEDLKKLLAYSTVENVGIVVIALGLAVAYKDSGEKALAALAMVAGLYHVLNHSIFKSLLFLGAGAVIAATGERRLSRLGGLLNRMPWTGAAVLVGAAAISALPPLNGFVSEWLVFQSLFKGPGLPHWAMKFGVPVVGALLALAAALAAACFVKAYGIAFLGRPRSAEAADACDATPGMRLSLAALAALCVVLGAVPVTVTDALSGVIEPMIGSSLAVSADLGWPWLSPVSSTQGSYSGTILVLVGLAMFAATIWVVHHAGTEAVRRADAWDCGHREDMPETQYTGEGFSQPLRRVFGATVFAAAESVDMPEPADPRPARLKVRLIDPVWRWLYQALGRLVALAADQVNRLQYLTVRRYLLMMFLTLVFLLLVVAWRQT